MNHYIIIADERAKFRKVRAMIKKADKLAYFIMVSEMEEAYRVAEALKGRCLVIDAAHYFKQSEQQGKEETQNFALDHGSARDGIRSLKEYIRTHLDEKLALKDLSRLLCISPNYLCSLFRECEGMSLNRFVTTARLKQAADYLLTENLRISEICTYVGIPNCSYFCRLFRRHYGVSPRVYRRQNARRFTG